MLHQAGAMDKLMIVRSKNLSLSPWFRAFVLPRHSAAMLRGHLSCSSMYVHAVNGSQA